MEPPKRFPSEPPNLHALGRSHISDQEISFRLDWYSDAVRSSFRLTRAWTSCVANGGIYIRVSHPKSAETSWFSVLLIDARRSSTGTGQGDTSQTPNACEDLAHHRPCWSLAKPQSEARRAPHARMAWSNAYRDRDRGRIRIRRRELRLPDKDRQQDHGIPPVGAALLRTSASGQTEAEWR